MLPAVAQGAIGVACRLGDNRVLEILNPLNHAPTTVSVLAERALLARLDGSCQTPIGALAKVEDNGKITLSGLLAAADGSRLVKGTVSGESSLSVELGRSLGAQLLSEAGPDFLLP